MSDTRLRVEINGDELTADLLEAGAAVEVEEAIDEPDAASVTVGIEARSDGEWSSLLDDLAAPDAELIVTVSRSSDAYTFAGLVVGASWKIDAEGSSEIVVRAVDRTVEMDRIERVMSWPGSADSAIASTIFSSYGFAAEVEPTPAGPSPDVFTPMQRGTDLAFLRSLAAKWGYSVFLEVDGDKVVGHFRPIDPLASASASLRLGFGEDAYSSQIEVDFDGGGGVRASRIAALADGATEAEVDGSDQLMGDEPIGVAATSLLGPADVDGEIDPFEAATAQARRAAFGVRLTVTTDPIRRGPLVRARRTVDVAGLGSRLSGLYLAERVRHRLDADHHEQEVVLVRNALGSGSGGLGGLGGLV
jgi:hypothetical protein